MKTLKEVAITLVLLALMCASIQVSLFVYDLRASAKQLTATLTQVSGAVTDLRAYTKIQADRLNDPRNSKSLDAAIQTAAVFNATGRLINKVLVPKAGSVLDELTATVNQLKTLTANTDKNLNQDLLPALASTAKSLDTSIGALNASLIVIANKSGLTLDDLHALLSDPQWKEVLTQVAGTAKNVEGMTAHGEEAMRQVPGIAADIHKISTTSSRYQKLIILARVLSLLVQAFI